MSIVERIEQVGIQVSAEDGKVVLEGNVQVLTLEQMEWIRANKPAILDELRQRVVSRLGMLAKVHRVPFDDLLDWYKSDIEYMTRLDGDALALLVQDYAKRRGEYRRTCRRERVA